MDSGLWVRSLLVGGNPIQDRCPATEHEDGTCPGQPVELTLTVRQVSKIDGGRASDPTRRSLRLVLEG